MKSGEVRYLFARQMELVGAWARPQEGLVSGGVCWEILAGIWSFYGHITGILSTFVPNFSQLWAPRGHRPQQGLKSAH